MNFSLCVMHMWEIEWVNILIILQHVHSKFSLVSRGETYERDVLNCFI